MSISAYKRTIRESASPKQIEARVFARVTGSMEQHSADWSAARGDNVARSAILAHGLRDAVAENRVLWSRLGRDLADSNNQLPAALRANLLSIALWVDRTSGVVIGGGEGLQALIDVNKNILGGLSGLAPAPAAVDQDGTQSHAQAV
ncbi:flagellar biosynthesis regulator FlaF [Sagittula sp. NFXS13]|uniref:flagellar biosynthesis regulator FlaF n=1 Tax=Sagittula sp. NFXS13 TaxID=2819095 RepID=UPI0032DE366E